jgi:hypothetical protein
MSKIGLALAFVAAGVAGAAMSELLRGSEARAAAVEHGRYQISSYGYGISADPKEHRSGAFIIDTENGEIYHTITGAGTEKVGRLPR